MMPMQMPRKSRTIRKSRKPFPHCNLAKYPATRRNKSDHVCALRWANFLPAGVPVRARSAGCHGVRETCAGPRSGACSIRPRRPAGQPRQVSVPDVGARQDRSAPILPDMSHFAAEFDEYCANPARPFQGTPKFGRIGLTFLRCSVTRFRVHRSQQQESWTCVFTTFARR